MHFIPRMAIIVYKHWQKPMVGVDPTYYPPLPTIFRSLPKQRTNESIVIVTSRHYN